MEGRQDPSISLQVEKELIQEPSYAEAETFEVPNDPLDAYGVVQEAECWSNILQMTNPEFHGLPSRIDEGEMSVEGNCHKFPTSFTSGHIDYLEDVTSFFPGSISSNKKDEDMIFTPALTSSGLVCMSTIKQSEEFNLGGQNGGHGTMYLGDSPKMNSSQTNTIDSSHTQRRVRKPTRRYIDESSDLNTRYVKKRKEGSASASKNKCQSVKCNKKPKPESEAIESLSEDFTFNAIQVPFGPLVPEECDKKVASDVVKVKSIEISRLGLKECDRKHASNVKKVKLNQLSSVDPKLCHKKHSPNVKKVKMNYVSSFGSEISDKKQASLVKMVKSNHISFDSEECCKRHAPNVSKDSFEEMALGVIEDDSAAITRSDGNCARRKHHRLWTISEVRKLVDGVSQCGVGKWSQIKRIFFSSSDYRTPVDLKDKWRNLLKASRLQNQSKKGDKGKQTFSWRPLPKSILNQVCELANVHPYPRNCKSKT
ncbi:PREDICTED: telomere repeat-binding protein 5 isoform X2 [Ipomoea nil]|uniref:telomere repeat-binding protein 5 isoform X2 n=1 Tax=Ipomoea nil TaxID=35883 RepID=UPI00090200F2|nr:PREDICTED: telomere repeat-binding protein 5 isoform X2 [Ipomoea nil]